MKTNQKHTPKSNHLGLHFQHASSFNVVPNIFTLKHEATLCQKD